MDIFENVEELRNVISFLAPLAKGQQAYAKALCLS